MNHLKILILCWLVYLNIRHKIPSQILNWWKIHFRLAILLSFLFYLLFNTNAFTYIRLLEKWICTKFFFFFVNFSLFFSFISGCRCLEKHWLWKGCLLFFWCAIGECRITCYQKGSSIRNSQGHFLDRILQVLSHEN